MKIQLICNEKSFVGNFTIFFCKCKKTLSIRFFVPKNSIIINVWNLIFLKDNIFGFFIKKHDFKDRFASIYLRTCAFNLHRPCDMCRSRDHLVMITFLNYTPHLCVVKVKKLAFLQFKRFFSENAFCSNISLWTSA